MNAIDPQIGHNGAPDPLDETPKFDAKAAADRVIGKLRKASTEADLNEAWESETGARRAIHGSDPAEYERVKAASEQKANISKEYQDAA